LPQASDADVNQQSVDATKALAKQKSPTRDISTLGFADANTGLKILNPFSCRSLFGRWPGFIFA